MRRSIQRQAVLDAIRGAPGPIGPQEIATALSVPAVNVRKQLRKLLKEVTISKVAYGLYETHPITSPQPPPGPPQQRDMLELQSIWPCPV